MCSPATSVHQASAVATFVRAISDRQKCSRPPGNRNVDTFRIAASSETASVRVCRFYKISTADLQDSPWRIAPFARISKISAMRQVHWLTDKKNCLLTFGVNSRGGRACEVRLFEQLPGEVQRLSRATGYRLTALKTMDFECNGRPCPRGSALQEVQRDAVVASGVEGRGHRSSFLHAAEDSRRRTRLQRVGHRVSEYDQSPQ